ncbi:MAG: amidohydrolase [Bacteroides sp.]|jgi:predicted amidohydrolase|nr:amidohydrolase [Bacteroides sp.]
MQNLTVTLVQTTLYWEDPARNLELFTEKISALQEDTDLIVLPEMFTTGFTMKPQSAAEPANGQALAWMKQMAASRNCVVCGSVAVEDKGRFYNRFFWVRPEGSFETYDKRHLFTYAGENKDYVRGNGKLIVELKGWKIMPMICYDIRFPVWSRNRYRGKEGFDYDVMLYVASWPAERSHTWRILLMARAIENQSYVIGVNRLGADENKIQYIGDSAVINPLGENLSNFLPNQEGMETVTLPRCQLDGFRDSFRAWADWDDFSLL